MTSNFKREKHLSDYLFILFKWKIFIFITSVIVIALAVTYSFSIPKTYKATAMMMIPAEKDMGLGSILSGGNSAMSFGAQLLGGGESNSDLILGLMNSRTITLKVVEKFDLFSDYEIADKNYDKVMKLFKGDLIFSPNEYGLIEVHVINKSPQLSADIANYFVYLADSLNIKLNIEQARNNREFVEKRFHKTVEDIKKAEEEYHKFQIENSAFEIPEQVKASIQAAAELDLDLLRKEILLNSIKDRVSTSSPTYKDLENQIKAIKEKLADFYSKSDEAKVFVTFKDIPDLQLNYVRLFREMEIQNKILEFIYPMYEQSKIDEQKSIPTLQVIDKAAPPQLKHAPKKALIIVVIYSLFFFLCIIFIFRADNVLLDLAYNNPLVEKEKRFYSKITKFFKIKVYD